MYLLKTKDQVLEVSKEFHAHVEMETDYRLKCFSANNGGEYHGPFDLYYRSHYIRLEKTPQKIHRLNRVTERMNGIIVNKISCTLSHAKFQNHCGRSFKDHSGHN